MASFLYLCREIVCIGSLFMIKMTKKISIVLVMLLFSTAALLAQNNTHSPFSRFGYGEMNENVPGAYRAMGGVGVGMRDSRVINPSQPASYTVVDSTTFMFDLAASGMWNRYTDGDGTRNRGNGNLEYLSLQFPIYKRWIGMSLGILPYSMLGYDITTVDSINSDYHYVCSYNGIGGITQVYGGLSFNILDWFAVGANMYYMFGEGTNSRDLQFTESLNPVHEDYILHVSDLRFRYGAQLFHHFDHHDFTLGAIFENKSSLRGDVIRTEVHHYDTISNSSAASDFPMVWGVGGSYSYKGRFTLAADFTRYCWASARYYDASTTLRDRDRLSVGFEYVNNPLGRRYIDHMPWRVGFTMETPYVSSIDANEYRVSIGTAFPLHNVATVLNTSLEYGHRGKKTGLEENYLRFTLNVSVSENWFFKRRL